VITHIEEAVENSEVTLGAFLGIEGAFDSTSFDIIMKAGKRHGLEDTICRWIGSMLGSRKITATLAGETLEGSVARGCPQGGVLSPLLWSLVVNELVEGLNGSGYYTLGYADDIAILIRGKFPNTVSELLQEVLSMVQQWCDRTQLCINPQKMVIVPFIRKKNLRGLKEPTLSRHSLQLSAEVKYLGLILDKGLAWKAQLKNVMNKAYRAFQTCKGTFGKTWGLKPRVVHWIYTMVMRTVLTYVSTVWWPRVRYDVSRTELSKIQRLACLAITGGMKATPTAAMEVLLGLPPLHVMIEAEAQARIYRLMCDQQWKPKSTDFGHTKKISGYGARTHPTDGV
jgi:hypothetical protein